MGWLSETGRVVALEADAVWVEADRSAACGKCSARAGCGQGALSALLQSGKGQVRAVSSDELAAAECQVGDAVVIQVPESTLLSGTLMIYGAPLLTGSVLSVLAAGLGDLWAAAGFCLGLLFGFAILRTLSRNAGGVLPGTAEPRLTAKHEALSGDLLAKH